MALIMLAAVWIAAAGDAHAARPHTLTSLGCIEEWPIDAGCASGLTSFGGAPSPGDVVVSPDGRHVYVGSGSGTITWFNRRADGTLEPVNCVRDPAPSQPESCGAIAPGLKATLGLTISPDGKDLYSVSGFGTIAHLRRAADGSLTSGSGCIEDTGAGQGCARQTIGLGGASDVAVSPDGRHVFVAGASDDAIVRLDRAADGSLTPRGCVQDLGAPTGCTATIWGLDGVAALAFAPGTSDLYAVSAVDSALRGLRVGADGTLTARDCWESPTGTACAIKLPGFETPTSVAVSPAGDAVYVTSAVSDGVFAFARRADGTLTSTGCVRDVAGSSVCSAHAPGLDSPRDLAVTPDGEGVVVRSLNAITWLERGPGGRLMSSAPVTCFAPSTSGFGCFTASGLGTFSNVGFNRIAITPDGTGVYATSTVDRALAMFSRQVAPRCEPATSSGPAGAAQSVPLSCRDANGDALTLEIVRGPGNGTLGEPTANAVAYTPAPGFSGVDTFEFRAVTDGATSAPALASVTVGPQPAAPTPPPATPPAPPAPPAVERLLAVIAGDTLTGRRGAKIAVRVATTLPATVRLDIRRGKARVATMRGTVGTRGKATLTWRARVKGKPAATGAYTLGLTATSADGQTVRDTARLKLRR